MTPETLRVYRSLNAAGEDNCCGPAALVLMTGQPIDVVQGVLRMLGRQPGEGTRGDIFAKAAQIMGLKIKAVSARDAIRRAQDGGRVFLFTRDHVMAASGGQYHDPLPQLHLPHVLAGIAVLN